MDESLEHYTTGDNSYGDTDANKMTEVLDQKKSTIDQLLTDEEDEDDEEEDINEDEEDESGEDGDDGEGSEEEDEESQDSEQSENEEEMDEESKSSYSMDTDDLPQVKTEDDPKPPKAKATEELTQADDENSSNAPPQQTGRKRKRKRGGGEKGKKKKSKNAKPVTLRRNIRDIIKENDLDKQTLNAQQEEAERRRRILEVQKALEEQRKKEKEENDSQLKSLLQMDDEDKSSDVIYLDSSDEGRPRRKSKGMNHINDIGCSENKHLHEGEGLNHINNTGCPGNMLVYEGNNKINTYGCAGNVHESEGLNKISNIWRSENKHVHEHEGLNHINDIGCSENKHLHEHEGMNQISNIWHSENEHVHEHERMNQINSIWCSENMHVHEHEDKNNINNVRCSENIPDEFAGMNCMNSIECSGNESENMNHVNNILYSGNIFENRNHMEDNWYTENMSENLNHINNFGYSRNKSENIISSIGCSGNRSENIKHLDDIGCSENLSESINLINNLEWSGNVSENIKHFDDIGCSGSISEDSDIIELSSDEEDVLLTKDEDSDVDPEDPNNAGNHINDALNVHDDFGRVLVNIGHPSDEPDIFLAPQIARYIKKHQIGGVRFLYDNLIESLSRFHNSPGFGCILAHSMGLGKTIQMISFVDVFLRCAKARTVLLIVPINTLQNWMAEFNMWCPTKEMVGDLGTDHVIPRPFNVFLLNDNFKSTGSRAKVIGEWYTKGGVLLMGYEMYRLLSSRKGHMADVKVKKPKKPSASPVVIDVDEEDKNKELLVGVHEALISPGPDLIVCDEGHRIKNSQAGISQSLKNIKTRRRVVLTGYPLQNNLMEYWCMVDFVRPNYLGTKTEFSNMFERPITNGQCQDSTPSDVKLMRYRAHVLHSLLEGFVQRRGHTVLQQALPPKQEFIFLVRMSPIQRTLYREFMNSLQIQNLGSWANTNPLKAFAVCCKIWNHPDILYNLIQKKKSITDDNDLDIETENGTGTKKKRCVKKKPQKSPQPVDQYYPPYERGQEISYEWVSDLLKEYTSGLLESGGKMVILFKVLEESLAIGDKILVFSQSLFTLDLLEEFLSKRKVPHPDMNENWCKNQSYFRLDGSTSAQEREKLINQFNSPDNTKAWLFLLSTRAGSLGVNLVGANRVVVLDASWNPCHDCQAICRVFRFGQVKASYIYRLVTDNSMEKKIYDRQVSKQGMSNRVIDEMQIQNHLTKRQVDSLLHYEDKEPEYVDFSQEDYEDPIMNKLLQTEGHWLTTKPFEHESLLIDKKELRLTKKEKRLAQQSYVMEKRLNVSYSRPSYAAFYPKGQEGNARQIKIVSPPSQPIWPSTTYTSRPVASVKPMITTPVPMQPKGAGRGENRNLPIISKNKPGVSVHKVLTTTDIMLPGTATSTQSTAGTSTNKIPAGQQIFIIKTPKGVYIRTNSGKIFAVRAKFPLSGSTTAVASSSSPLTSATNSSTSSALTTADLLASSEEASDSQGESQSSSSSSKDQDASDILASLYGQEAPIKPAISRSNSSQDNPIKSAISRTDSSASLASQFGKSDMLGDLRQTGNAKEVGSDSAMDKQTDKVSDKSESMDSQPDPTVSKEELFYRKSTPNRNPSNTELDTFTTSQMDDISNLINYSYNTSNQMSSDSNPMGGSSMLNNMDSNSSMSSQLNSNSNMSHHMSGKSNISHEMSGNSNMSHQLSGNSNMSHQIGGNSNMSQQMSGNSNMLHQMEGGSDMSNQMDGNMRSQLDYSSNMSNQMGGNSNHMSSGSNYMGGGSNMSNHMGVSSMPSHMGNNSNLPPYPLPGGMGPSHVPFLFQNQLMYPQGGGYPPMSGMGSMPYSSPITSTQDAVTSSVSSSLAPTSSNMSMPSMPGMPSMPMMGFPFAPYPFPMPQPYLMPGMDPNYMSQLSMPGHQRYNMHHGMHMPGSGPMMPPEYPGSKDYMNQSSSDCQSNQSLDMRHQDNSNM